MMSHLNKKTWLTIGAILVVVGAFAFFLFGGREAAPPSGLSSVGESPLGDTLGRDLLTLLARLRTTELDTSLFADPLFLGLRDFGVAITPQPVGRRNPFEAFEGEIAAAKSKTVR